ncbi:ASCH domain-containing protein [Novosphingobium resinovorum]|uniref:ASCH domain-containing protein n=1 Tax=Novosphingobium resinovorum TaxID=158500 RepID=UPI002ED16B56|nr:ASCH domain-containing protein [Novosphingobium resinovorum]
MYLPDGCARPRPEALAAFWQEALAALPAGTLAERYTVRWIGTYREGTSDVLDLILAGDKTGTFTLPWIVEHTDQPEARPGDCIVLIDYDGIPSMIVRIDAIDTARWGALTEAHTAVDGTPVRDLRTWIPLHTTYWDGMLAPFGLAVTDGMPIWIERFTPLFSRWPRQG